MPCHGKVSCENSKLFGNGEGSLWRRLKTLSDARGPKIALTCPAMLTMEALMACRYPLELLLTSLLISQYSNRVLVTHSSSTHLSVTGDTSKR